MKPQPMYFIAAIAAATLAVGCATTGPTATTPPGAMRGNADAVIHIAGLS